MDQTLWEQPHGCCEVGIIIAIFPTRIPRLVDAITFQGPIAEGDRTRI